MNNEYELMHFGVKGMRWGMHIAKNAAKNAAKSMPYKDVANKAITNASKNSAGRSFDRLLRPVSDRMTYGPFDKKVQQFRINRANNALKKQEINSNYTESSRGNDYKSFKKSGVRRINKRMNSGLTYEQSVKRENGRQFVNDITKTVASQAVKTFAVAAVTKIGKDAIQGYANRKMGVKYLPSESSYGIIDLMPGEYKIR